MKSRLATKQGDAGQSRALDGNIYSKAHPLMECVGALDEVRAQVSLLRIIIRETQPREHERVDATLVWILHVCFPIGTECSDPLRLKPEMRSVEFSPTFLTRIEAELDHVESQIELEKVFVAGASNRLAAQADLANVTVRRMERAIVRLREAVPEFPADEIMAFVNRLSDYFFALARFLELDDHMNVDYTILKEN